MTGQFINRCDKLDNFVSSLNTADQVLENEVQYVVIFISFFCFYREVNRTACGTVVRAVTGADCGTARGRSGVRMLTQRRFGECAMETQLGVLTTGLVRTYESQHSAAPARHQPTGQSPR